MIKRLALVALTLALSLVAQASVAGDLVRLVRFKLSAGDLPSGIAAVEDYKKATGVDAEYLDAIGWLARGAEMLKRPDMAEGYVAELRREIKTETPELVVPLGAAIEVEAKLIATRDGRGAAVRFLQGELAHASAVSLRSRINKNINLLSPEGHSPLALDAADYVGAEPPSLDTLHGSPVLMFFWAWGCGDCKAQAPSLVRVWQKYKDNGLAMITATRAYGSVHDKPATPAEEKVEIEKTWRDLYRGLDGVTALISTETMERYGVSATPTFVLVDRKGKVRLYAPTRLSEAELSRRIEEVLGEAP
ncbi:MAG TPA: TlpA disulfide reductase family protein [Thermoanaerobaculia bacterium]|nr:TlpA disulfide reductase family protein [Thermoanaerobaculia bacterium]